MFTRLRKHFGTAGLLVAVVALVAAVGGSAIAANTASDSGKRNAKAKKKKAKGVTVAQVRRIAKQEARKFANSNPGPAGPAGPQGPAGVSGKDGSNGAPGSPGKSVTVTEIVVGEEDCEEVGGAFVEEEGAGSGIEICNGEDGQSGFTATLPPNETEKGAWTWSAPGPGFAFSSAISFNIPLTAPLDTDHVHYINGAGIEVGGPNAGNAQAACTGDAVGPTAASGHLCVYQGVLANGTVTGLGNPANGQAREAGVAGAFLSISASGVGLGSGTWAVTG